MSTSSSIRAWVYDHKGYPSALHQSTITLKPDLAATEVRIAIKAAALNPVDIQLMNLPIWPYLPTSLANPTHGLAEDFSGVVLSAGSSSGFKPGDPVFGMVPILSTGVLQSTIVTDTRTTPLVLKPSAWTHEQAAALPLAFLTARTLIATAQSHLPPQPSTSPTVVVLGGSSATGQWMVRLATRLGWSVHASCSPRNADWVRGLGAEVIDYTSATTTVSDTVRKIAPDVVLDCVGGTECLGLARKCYLTIVGDKTSRANMGGSATYLWNPQMLVRSWLGRLGWGSVYKCVNLEMKREWLEETLEFKPEEIVVDSVWAFEDVPKAFEKLNTGRARGKVVVTVDGNDGIAAVS